MNPFILGKMRPLLFLWMALAGTPALHAQSNGIEQESDLHINPAGDKFLRWHGHENRNYFLQVSEPTNHLRKWTWAAVIEAGNDEQISYEVDGTADKGFFRLKYTSIQPKPGETLEAADFDSDGISNIDEIAPPGPFGQTDPLLADTDGDGLLDGWEVRNDLDPTDDGSIDPDNGAYGDKDTDGWTNAAEAAAGTPANDAAKFPPHAVMIARSAAGNSTSLGQIPGGTYSCNAEWDDENPLEDDTPDAVTPDFLQGLYSENGFEFPDVPTESMNTSVMGLDSCFCSSEVHHTSSSEGSGYSSRSRNARVWLRVPTEPAVRNFAYLRVKRELTVSVPFVTQEKWISMTPVTFVIPADATYSLPLDINPVPTAVANKNVILTESLVPIQIKEISFEGDKYHGLKSDDLMTPYSAPHWADVDGDGKAMSNRATGEVNHPVAFTGNSKVKVGARFKVSGLKNGETVAIKATSPSGLAIPETTVTSDADGVIILPSTESTTPLPQSVQFHDSEDDTAFVINWQMKVGTGDWGEAGSTKHTVCVTRADPVTSFRQVTLFVVACKNAVGKTTVADITEGIWNEFSDREVKRFRGSRLTYYANYNNGVANTEGLLSKEKGDGECGAWAKFFIDVRKVHGIDDANEYATIKAILPVNGLLVKNWTFPAQGASGNASYPFMNVPSDPHVGETHYNWEFAEVTDSAGLEGQGNDNPASFFFNHQLVKISGKYYDPSYGIKHETFESLEDTIAGFHLKSFGVANGAVREGLLIKKNPPGKDLEEVMTNY